MSASTAQLRFLSAIQLFSDTHRYGPSFRDLAEALGFGSTNAVVDHLKRLRQLGLANWEPGIARSVHLTAAGLEAVRPTATTNVFRRRA